MEAIRWEAIFADILVESTNSSLGESDLDRGERALRPQLNLSMSVGLHQQPESGLGQHVRHRHPNLANELRLKAVR